MHKYKGARSSSLMGGPSAENNDINIYSLTSLLQATSLTVEQIVEYLEIMKKKIFNIKTYEELVEIKKKTDLNVT